MTGEYQLGRPSQSESTMMIWYMIRKSSVECADESDETPDGPIADEDEALH